MKKQTMYVLIAVTLTAGWIGGMFLGRSLYGNRQQEQPAITAIEDISVMKDFCRTEIRKCNDQLDSLYVVTMKATTDREFDQIEASLSQIQENKITYKGILKGLEIAESFLQ